MYTINNGISNLSNFPRKVGPFVFLYTVHYFKIENRKIHFISLLMMQCVFFCIAIHNLIQSATFGKGPKKKSVQIKLLFLQKLLFWIFLSISKLFPCTAPVNLKHSIVCECPVNQGVFSNN